MRLPAITFFFLCRIHCLAWIWLRGKRPRDYLPARVTLNAHSTRATEPGRSPSLRREGEEKPAARREKRANVPKKCISYKYIRSAYIYTHDFPSEAGT